MKKLYLLLTLGFICVGANAQISGTVYRDYNGNGAKGASAPNIEPGINGIIVNAYNSSDVILASYLSNSTGVYSIPASGTYNGTVGSNTGSVASGVAVRLEFVIPSSATCASSTLDFSSPSGGTSIQFTTGGSTNINYGINNPEDYANNTNPDVFLSQFINGDPTVAGTSQTNTWFRGFPYNNTGTTAVPKNLNGATIGSVWGVAYSKQAKKIFTSAFLKRHCGLGTLGSGGIYILTPTATSFTAASFYDMDANGHRTRAASGTYGSGNSFTLTSSQVTFTGTTDILTGQPNGLGVIGSNTNRGLGASATAQNNDPAAFDQTCKVGLGDLEISEDGKFLFVMNLYSRLLFRLELNDAYNPTSVIAVTSYALPTVTVTNGVLRPFAVKYSKEKIFVGALASGENAGVNTIGGTTNMFAYVFELNNPKGVASFNVSPVITFPLNHLKGQSWDAFPTQTNRWYPWSKTTTLPFGGATNKSYPTPLLSNIEFSDNGAMILDFCDRSGHQYGNWNYRDLTGTATASIFVGGDLVIAGKNCGTGAYSVESNGSYNSEGVAFTSSTGVGNNTGLATINGAGNGYTGTAGEFFNWDDAQINGDNANHADCMQGGAAVLRGDAKVFTTHMDPIIFNTGGTSKQSTTNGVGSSGYQLYASSGSSIDAFFNKGNGLGDVEFLSEIAPIQIGNRVWNDANSDGIQGADEVATGAGGLLVTLRSPGVNGSYGDGDDQITTTTTDAGGNYYFSTLAAADNRKPATWTSIGSTILPGFDYRIEIAVPAGSTITTADVSSNGLDLIDNDAILNGANAVVNFNTENTNHNFDFGFTCGTTPPSFSSVYTPATCLATSVIPQNDATVQINTSGDRVAISPTGVPTTSYAVASVVASGSFTFTAQNGATDSFWVRIFSGPLCYLDTIIVVTPVKCCPTIATIATPASNTLYCSGSTIPAFNVLTNAIATDSIRLVSFNSQQTNASTIYNSATVLATKVITGVAATVTNTANFTLVPLPTNLGPDIDTLWIYAIYIDKTGDTTCKVFAEKPIRILPKPSFSFNYTQATCSATSITPLNTASVQIFTTGDKVAISATGTPTTTYALATTVTSGSATLINQNGATDTFFVRIFNTAACFFDTVIAVTPVRCCPAITFGTPADNTAYCSGATIASFVASTNAKSPDQIRYYLYTSQQTTYNDIVNGGGTVLGTSNIVGVATTVTNTATLTNVVLPTNLSNTQTLYIYAVYVDASTDTTCKIFVEKPIILNPKPTANISGLHFACNSTAVTLTSDAATTYKWGKSPAATVLSAVQAYTFTPTINSTSIYWLVVTNAGACASDTAFHTLITSTGITGVVFRDFNSNGIQETTETDGVANVKVRAYNAAGVIIDSMLTDVNGQYYFTSITPAMGKVRIEFVKSTLPASYLESFAGTDNGSDVQFVTAPNCNVNWGVKIDGDYCQANPTIALSRYVNGASSNNENMIARFNYNDINTSPTPGSFAKANEIGSVWGLAYNKKRKEMYSGTFLKRHVGIKDYDNDGNPDLGVIWKTSNLSVTTPTNSVWVDLTKAPYNLDFGKIGTDASRGLGARTAPSNDPTTFPLIGKIGFGDIDISEDGSSLWAVNPKANQLYKIAINTDGTPGALSTFNIPNIGSGNYDTLFVKAGGTLNGSLVNSYIGDEYYKGGTVITNTTQAGSSFSTARTGASFDYLISLPNGTYDVLLSFGNNATARDQKNTIGGVVQNLTIPASTSSTQLFSSITITDDRLDIKIEDNPGGTSTAAILSGIKIWSNSNIPFEDRSYPFALKYKNGNVYVGTTYGAELTQNKDSLRSSIFKLEDNGSTVFTPVINIPLNYKKGPPTPGEPILQTRWQAWTGAMDKGSYNLTFFTHIYVQPILSDIEFIDDGDMVLGFFDRYGHQTGDYNYPTTGTSVVRTCSGGDILRADFSNGTYTLENNGTVGNNSSASGINNQEGPGNGEFYAGDLLSGAHNETSYGGLMFLPGTNEIGLSVMDPINVVASGVKYLSNTTGSSVRNYQVTGSNFSVDYFSKANALGDLELLCDAAPLQIGNYVWIDLNSNGVQDPNESPIPNVAVTLWKAGTQIATATTNANGEYYFSTKSVLGAAWTGTGADTALLSNTAYEVRILMSQTNIATPNYLLTSANSVVSNGNDQNDNDATLASGYATIAFTTGEAGTINHTYDFGFLCSVPNVSYTYTQATCPANLILANNNASLAITTNGNKIAMSTTGVPVTTYAAASTITGGTFTFTAQNGTVDSFYVRVWNGDGCFKDTLIVVTPVRCCPTIAAIATPVSNTAYCSGTTIPAFNVLTNAIATDSIRLVYFNTQQTNATTIYNSGTTLATKVITGVATTVTNTANFTLVPLPANNGTTQDSIWIYAIYIDKTGDVTCKIFSEKLVLVSPAQSQVITGYDYSCNAGAMTLSTNGALTYQWGRVSPASTTLGTTQSISVTPTSSSSTTYWVITTNLFSCKSDTIFHTVAANDGIYGTVYNDFNANGAKDANEIIAGFAGITVRAYNAAGVLIESTTTDSKGRYKLNAVTSAMGQVRVEFDKATFPSPYKSSFVGLDNGSDVQFVTATSCAVDLGLYNPDYYCQANPAFAQSYFTRNSGEPGVGTTISMMDTTGSRVFVGGAATDATNPWSTPSGGTVGNFPIPTQVLISNQTNTGTTFGLAWDNIDKKLFTGSFMKSYASPMKSNASSNAFGEGIIYQIPVNGATVGTPSVWLDLETLLGNGISGIYLADANHPNTFGITGTNPNKIGYTGLGSIKLSKDATQMYVANLATQEIFVIPMSAGGVAPASAASIKRFKLPTIEAPGNWPDGRPHRAILGLGVHPATGRVYTTLTCTGPLVTNMKGIVYSFDPNDATPDSTDFVKELEIPMNIERPASHDNTSYNNQVNHPWETVTAATEFYPNDVGNNLDQSTQQWLGEIGFDLQPDGNYGMIIGERNRYHDMIARSFYVAGGTMYRASKPGASWILETNGFAGNYSTNVDWTISSTTTAGGNTSPENRFFKAVGKEGAYAQGTLGILPGINEVMLPAMDNVSNSSTSGISWLNIQNGDRVRDNRLVGNFASAPPVSFIKANNFGDIEPLCAQAPLQIGNYVWFDADNDGVQDPNEASMQNIVVSLWKGGAQIASTTTNASGEYYFSAKAALGAGWTGTGADTTLLPLTAYEVRINMTTYSSNILTATNSTSGNGNDQNDNDATLISGYAVISFTTESAGSINHTYDFGFNCTQPTVSYAYTPATCPANLILASNNASLQISTNGDKVAMSTTGIPTTLYSAATTVVSGTYTFTAQNGTTDSFYVRVWSGTTCFRDTLIVVTPVRCCPTIATIATPVTNTTYCAGALIPAFNVSTNAIATDSVRLVYFTSQQTNPTTIYNGPTLAQKVIVGVATTVTNTANFTNIIIPSSTGSSVDTLWIYAIYIDKTGDTTCKVFKEKSIIREPNPTQVIYGYNEICTGGSVTLTTNGAVTYQWGSVVPPSSTLGTTQSITVTPAATTTYWVKGTNPIFACASDTAYFTVTPAPGIYGSVFYDFNSNGTKDANESNGVSGISVKAYDSTGVLLATVTTNNLGRYHFASITPAMGKVRVEFDKTTYPAGFNSSFVGTDNGSDVQFVTANECSADLGLFTSSQYCQINPNFALVRFERNTAAAANTTISMMGNNANTQNFTPLSASDASYTWGMPSVSGGFPGNFPVAAQTTLSTVGNTGSTFGLTYDNKNNLLFTSAYMRAFAPMKANASSNSFGEAVIYSIPVNGSTVGTPTPWLDLETLLGDGVAGIFIPDGAYPTSQTLFGQTGLNPNKIGYTGLGGMQMSADGSQLYVVNLAGKEVLVIPIGVGGTAPTVAAAIKRFPLPTTDVSGTYPDGRSIATVLGLGVHPITGRVYATLTKTGPTVSDLRGYVYSFDPNDNTPSAADYTKELEIPMNIVRPSTNVNVAQFYDEVNHPWEAVTASTIFYNNNGDNFSQHTQPWLGEIAFDLQVDGTYGMTIAERNRYHDIIHSSFYVAGGLLYKASLNGSTWTLENNGVVTPASTSVNWTNNTVNTAGSNSSPTNRFYRNAGVEGTYSAGTIGHIQGSNEVMTPALDNIFHSAGSGVAWLSTVNGNRIKDNHLYGNNTFAGYFAVPFTKANNWGDIEPLCDEAPLQIGNYVWFDTDADGVQDPNEAPIQNTTVTLWKAGTQIASTTTNIKGEYYFSENSAAGVTWTGTGADTSLLPSTAYEVRILMSQTTIATPNYSITQINSTTNSGNDQNDNDAALNTGYAVIALTTGDVGSINHTYDFGFTTSLPYGSIGNYVWTDVNANGTNDEATTAGVNGVKVYLYDNANPTVIIDSMFTANNGSGNPGYYLFDSLASGTYFVKFPTTNSGNILTTQTTTAQTDNNSDANTTTGISPLVVINATGTGQDKDNTTIDAGYKNCITSSITTLTACNAYTWTVNGVTYTNGGTYTSTSLNANSCLHTDSLILTVNYSSSASTSITACNTYLWSVNNVSYTSSGTYTSTSLNAGGCVKTDSLVLIINLNTSASTSATSCISYTWSVNGLTYTTSGTYTSTSLNASGCVHTESLVLTITPSAGVSTTLTACDAYTWVSNNVTYTATGTYTNPVGSCGTDTLNLTVNTSTTSSTSETSCGTYTWNANNVTYTASGTYTATSLNAGGCVHTSTLVLTINPTPVADAGADINLNCSNPSGMIGTSGIVGNTYFWLPTLGLSASNIAQPIANPIVTTSYTVTVTGSNGCTKTDVVLVNVNPAHGSIGNYVWYDADGNGLNNEASTQGLNGVIVELYKETSSGSGVFTIIGSTTTANNTSGDPGYYNFEICETANYKVKFPVTNSTNVLTIETITSQTDNNSDANNADGFSPITAINILGTGQNKDNTTIDAGYTPPVGSIGNYVWNDANHDGLNGESPTSGINGVKVYLYGAGVDNAVGGGDDVLLDSVNTANNSSGNPGYYLFPGLPSGNYFIDFPITVSGKNLTLQTTTSQLDNNSDANLVNGNSPLVIINASGFGQDKNNTTIDAGYYASFPCQTPNCRTLSSKTIIN